MSNYIIFDLDFVVFRPMIMEQTFSILFFFLILIGLFFVLESKAVMIKTAIIILIKIIQIQVKNMTKSLTSIESENSKSACSDNQQKLSGWTPIVKLITIKNCAIKTLWALFTICMIIALISSLSVVVHRYLKFVTVVRLDQRGPKDSVIPPAVTVCLKEHELKQISLNYYRSNPKWDIVKGKHVRCQENSKLVWDSTKDAISTFYNHTTNFQVIFKTQPPGCFSLIVIEQVPNPSMDFICTTFQLNKGMKNTSTFWKIVSILVDLILKKNIFDFYKS